MKSMALIVTLVINVTAMGPEQYLFSKGRTIYDQLCAGCHSFLPPPKTAPPISKISSHYHTLFSEKDSAINFLMDYIKSPSAEKALVEDFALDRFGVMPPVPMEDSDLKAVSSWFWQIYYEPELSEELQVTVTSLSSTEFKFSLPDRAPAYLSIYTLDGNLVSEVNSETGTASLVWHGKDLRGNDLPEGDYDFLIWQNGLDTMGTIHLMRNTVSDSVAFLKKGFTVYIKSCRSCHKFDNATGTAPSIKQLSAYYHNKFSDKAVAVEYMADYIQSPSAEKSKLPPEEQGKFDLMIPVLRSREELKAASAWIWQAYNEQSQNFSHITSPALESPSINVIYRTPSIIEFILPKKTQASLTIFGSNGAILHRIDEKAKLGRIFWETDNNREDNTSPGIYYYQIIQGAIKSRGILDYRKY